MKWFNTYNSLLILRIERLLNNVITLNKTWKPQSLHGDQKKSGLSVTWSTWFILTGGLWWAQLAPALASTSTRWAPVPGTPWFRDTRGGVFSPLTHPASWSRWPERTGATSRTRLSPGSTWSILERSSPTGLQSSHLWRSSKDPGRPFLCLVSEGTSFSKSSSFSKYNNRGQWRNTLEVYQVYVSWCWS